MDDYQAVAHRERMRDIRGHAVAFLMLGISLFALYTHTLYLAIIPLLWLAFRAGKESGREQAHKDIEQASAMKQLIQVSDARETRGGQTKTSTRFR